MNSFFRNTFSWFKGVAIVTTILLAPNVSLAAGPPKPSALDNPLAIVLMVIIVGLLLVIGLLAYVVLGAAQVYTERFKEANKKSGLASKAVAVLAMSLASSAVFAADAPAEATTVAKTIAGLDKLPFYALMSVIGIELLVILLMLVFLKRLLAKERALAIAAKEEALVQKEGWFKKFWVKINSFKSLNEEADIDMGHDYDNIRELDNRLPPWWLYGFYVTIIFAGIYLWRYHVTHTAPLSAQELEIALQQAEEEKAAYLAKAGNMVDEKTVKMLDEAGITAGKTIFTQKCAACHAPDGGGVVGPNLTDDYWLHGGSINDVFKTIKYGVPEKGMLAWKDQLSPKEIAQVASFIKSIKGAKVATAKEPQGTLFKEDATTNAADSTKKIAASN